MIMFNVTFTMWYDVVRESTENCTYKYQRQLKPAKRSLTALILKRLPQRPRQRLSEVVPAPAVSRRPQEARSWVIGGKREYSLRLFPLCISRLGLRRSRSNSRRATAEGAVPACRLWLSRALWGLLCLSGDLVKAPALGTGVGENPSCPFSLKSLSSPCRCRDNLEKVPHSADTRGQRNRP